MARTQPTGAHGQQIEAEIGISHGRSAGSARHGLSDEQPTAGGQSATNGAQEIERGAVIIGAHGVTGEVRLVLEPGRCAPNGRRALAGLYDYELATYEAEDAFRHEDAAGFVRLWGLGVETWSKRQRPGGVV